MVQLLLERLSSLELLKNEIIENLESLREDEKRMKFEDSTRVDNYLQGAESLVVFINVYKKTLTVFMNAQKARFTFDQYQEHMKEHDNELQRLCGQYTFLKVELFQPVE
ncbi:hypothetical protein ACFVS2_22195 [Brevibacillus sp. NPDC058079]|uniref:hypothetical protein n=1 Tax=Brevibacillus sp. NPDC058079 TaxID=3346330 RepID=UPI0036EF4C0E